MMTMSKLVSAIGSHHHQHRVLDQPLERADQFGTERADIVALIICAASILPSRTTARSSPAPTARIVDCGGLITAVKSLMPYMPKLDTDDVPPWYSCGLSLRPRARATRSLTSFEVAESDFVSALRTMGVISPAGSA